MMKPLIRIKVNIVIKRTTPNSRLYLSMMSQHWNIGQVFSAVFDVALPVIVFSSLEPSLFVAPRLQNLLFDRANLCIWFGERNERDGDALFANKSARGRNEKTSIWVGNIWSNAPRAYWILLAVL